MRICTMLPMLLLCACSGITRNDFLQDKQNKDKYDEIKANFTHGYGCDKLLDLYNFALKESPTKDDLIAIMPAVGFQPNDATDLDKVYKMDLSVIDKYNCDDNSSQMATEIEKYCNNKYSGEVLKKVDCIDYLKQAMLKGGAYNDSQTAQNQKHNIEWNVRKNISKIYPIPQDSDELLAEFTASELIKANNTILGVYDYDCSRLLCGYNDTRNVTRLSAAMVLQNFCNQEHWQNEEECVCYAHETYKKVDYKNVIYIYEKGAIPQSKKAEFDRIFTQCEQKIEREHRRTEQNRYGEASVTNSGSGANKDVFREVLDNVAWTHKMITETRKEAEQKRTK